MITRKSFAESYNELRQKLPDDIYCGFHFANGRLTGIPRKPASKALFPEWLPEAVRPPINWPLYPPIVGNITKAHAKRFPEGCDNELCSLCLRYNATSYKQSVATAKLSLDTSWQTHPNNPECPLHEQRPSRNPNQRKAQLVAIDLELERIQREKDRHGK